MATSDILGLFMSPEQYQAQQMAQQQAGEQQRAINFANLDPRGQAVYGTFLGGQQLGRGLAGLLGVQDPQLQRIRQRQEIMQTINPADPESLMAGIQRASQMGDQELALTLADYTRKARGDLALAEQREREKVPEAIQIAEEIRKLTVQRDALPEGLERNSIDAKIKRLQLAQKATGSTDTEAYKNAFQLTVAQNPTLDTESQEFQGFLATNLQSLLLKDKPESKTEAQRNAYDITLARYPNLSTYSPEFKTEYGKILDSLVSKKDGRQIEKLVINSEIVRLKELQAGLKKDSPEYKSYQDQIEFLGGGAGKNKVSAFGQLLIDKGIDPGSKEWNDKMDAYITKELAGKQEKGVSFGTDREAIAEEFFEAPFKDLTKEQKAKVNAVKEEREGVVAQKSAAKFVLPGETKPVDILTFRKTARDTLAPYVDTIDNGDNALAALKNARTPDGKTNPSSFTQGVAYLASMAQSGRLSNKDVELVKEDPAVLRSLGNYISTKWEGVPLQPTINEIMDTVKIIRKVAKAKYERELSAQRRLADLAGIPPTQRDALFEDIAPKPSGDGTKPPPKKAVPYSALPR